MDEPAQTLNPAALASQIAKDAPRLAQSAPEIAPAAETQPAPAAESAPSRDSAGRAWDAAKYRANADGTPYVNKFGNYMPAPRPRGTRKARERSADETAMQAETPLESDAPAWSEAERAEALAVQPAAQSAGDAPAQAPVASAETTAEVASNALYTLTGAAIGNHKAARPGSAEHTNIKKTIAAYLEYRGILFSGAAAIAITLLAYLMGEERREILAGRVKALAVVLRKKREPKTVQPAPSTAAQQTAPQPMSAFDL